jgi:hypothetical protein
MAGGLTLGVDWESLGAEASAAVDAAHAILVTGRDPVAAARVAVGLGQVQSRSRRVAIGDLVGDVEPLQRLATGDDPHGIVDSFVYGVSLNKIARQVDDAGMLFVMPSGTEPTVTADIISNERWSRLAAGFREVGALLVLVAPSDVEGVHALAGMLDGVIVVGDAASVLAVPRNSVLAHVEAPMSATPLASDAIPELPPASAPPRRSTPVVLPPQETAPTRKPNPFSSGGIPKVPLVLGLIAAAMAVWFALGRPGMPSGAPAAEGAGDTSGADGARATGDSTGAGADAATAAGAASVRIANPADSTKAAPYGVVLVATNDEALALARWAELGLKLPAGTVTMVRVRGERGRFFQVQAGAFRSESQADSLLTALRANRRLPADAGSVKATPFALRLDDGVPRTSAKSRVDAYGLMQIPAYALLQADNTVTIYVGAFETPEQAAPLMNELQRKSVNVALHYRTGRSF